MKNIRSVIHVMLVLGFVIVPSIASGAAVKEERPALPSSTYFTKQVLDILLECGKIVPGSTRADLLKIFTTEGGLQPAHRTFVHRQCRFIKVDVEFTLSNPRREEPTDIVIKISKPIWI